MDTGRLIEPLLRFAVRRPRTVLAIFAAVTLLAAALLPALRLDMDGRALLPSRAPALVFDERTREVFGLRDTILIGVFGEEPGAALHPPLLALVSELTEAVSRLPGIVSSTVLSPATIRDVEVTDERMRVGSLIRDPDGKYRTEASIQNALKRLPHLYGLVVSNDASAVAIVAELDPDADRTRVVNAVRDIAAEHQGGPAALHIGGSAVAETALGRSVLRDLLVVLPGVAAIVALCLFLAHGHIGAMMLPLIEVMACLVWTGALMVLCDTPIYLVTAILPPIVMAIGVADEIHIFERFARERAEAPAHPLEETIVLSIKGVWRPILFTTLTTSAAFLSFTLTDMPPLRAFGMLSAFAITAALICSVTFIPAALSLLAGGWDLRPQAQRLTAPLARAAGATARHPVRVALVAGSVFVVSLLGISQLRVYDSWIANFDPAGEIVRADRAFNHHFGGSNLLEIILDAGKDRGWQGADLFHRLRAFTEETGARPEVGAQLSVIDYVKSAWEAAQAPSGKSMPEHAPEIAGSLIMASTLVGPTEIGRVIEPSGRLTRIQLFLKEADYQKVADLLVAVERSFERIFGGTEVTLGLAGDAYLSQVTVGSVVRNQLTSVGTSLILCFLLTAALFRSLRLGLICLAPIGLAVSANFGLMGLAGIPLGVASSMFASLAVGIGIDYAIHFTAAHRDACPDGAAGTEAVEIAASTSGRAILVNALTIALGFFAMLLCDTLPNQRLGLLIGISMVSALVWTMVLLPPLLTRLAGKQHA